MIRQAAAFFTAVALHARHSLHKQRIFRYFAAWPEPSDPTVMTYLRLSALLAVLLLAGCSTYRTNSDLSFDTVQLDQYKPVIPVGDVDFAVEELTFLGWVEAEVTKPSILHDDPTERQAAIVLGYLAQQEKNADAVIHVSYKLGGNLSPLTRMVARGQAVLINRKEAPPAAVAGEAEAVPEAMVEAKLEASTDTAAVAAPAPAAGTRVTDTSLPASATSADTPTVAPDNNKQHNALDVEAELAKATARITDADRVPYPLPAAAQPATKMPAPAPADPAIRLYDQLIERDLDADRRERIDLILNNVYYLQQKARRYNDKDMQVTTERMIQLLNKLRQSFETTGAASTDASPETDPAF